MPIMTTELVYTQVELYKYQQLKLLILKIIMAHIRHMIGQVYSLASVHYGP